MGKRISELVAAGSVELTDLLAIVKGDATLQATMQQLVDLVAANITVNPYPVGSTYVQFAAAESNDIATAFPSSREPATLFGGTWSEMFSGESSISFRTVGNETTIRDDGRTNGRQEDQFQGHYHQARDIDGNPEDELSRRFGSGPDRDLAGGSSASTSETPFAVLGPRADGTNGTPRTGAETRMTNRLIKVWERTA